MIDAGFMVRVLPCVVQSCLVDGMVAVRMPGKACPDAGTVVPARPVQNRGKRSTGYPGEVQG
ncbi:hypothetical protein [Candidatus Nitrotoga fabula]|uniref:hypothetical protein n=1 Tax=Candidatus Nitrotoga fabula TaxID=2182327 RepID=UPI001BB47CD2|nr:hypothetical protein [Candidatus Nitrotoga fabula]